MSDWNFNISEAPRGHYETDEREVKGKVQTYQRFVPDKIIATDGTIVTVSYWIPPNEKRAGRWAMFATGQEPVAFQLWPDAPEVLP